MNELEQIKLQEKALKEKKKKVIAKEYEKLGRSFYKKSHAKSFDSANNMLNHIPMFSKSEPSVDRQISDRDFAELQRLANDLKFQEQGQYWRTNEIKEVTTFLAKFRTEK